jgi:outer membrane protein
LTPDSDAFLTSKANVRCIKPTRKALESAAKSREAMETGFGYGVETISDVLKAQEEEFKAKRDLAKTMYGGYIKNRMRFMQAIRMISEENLAQVNGWLQTTAAVPPKVTETLQCPRRFLVIRMGWNNPW